MKKINRFPLLIVLPFICTLFTLAQAQTPRMTSVNIAPESDSVHISAIGDATQMSVEISDEAGDVVFQSGAISGQTLDWKMTDAQGERVQPGTYFVTVTFHNAAGKLRKRVEQVTVAEEDKAGTQASAAPAAPDAVQATITGSGMNAKVAKFTGASTIGVSPITVSAVSAGINVNPTATLQVNGLQPATSTNTGTNASALLKISGGKGGKTTGAGKTGGNGASISLIAGNGGDAVSGATNGSGGSITLQPGSAGIGGTGGDAGNVLIASKVGRVAIGTTNLTNGKLDVVSRDSFAAVFGEGPNNGVWGVVNGYAGSGIVGESKTSSAYAGFFMGLVRIKGDLYVDGSINPMSDRQMKANFSIVNPRSILNRLASIPIQSWNYKSEPDAVRHIGPMAQDFSAAFGVGTDDKHISTVDADGVTMAAIQGLYQMMQEKDRQIEQQSQQIAHLQSQVAGLKRTVWKRRAGRRSQVR